jgi:hypothetical protein
LYFLSKISRLELPCINLGERSNVEEQFFDLQEAVQVGIVFSLYMNSVIWIICCIAFRDWEVVIVLFISIMILPLAMGIIFIWLGRHFIEKSYAMYGCDQNSNFLSEHQGVNPALESPLDMNSIDLPEDGSRNHLINNEDKQPADSTWRS